MLPLSPIHTLAGRLAVPGDKSISHRYVLLGALAQGRTTLEHLSPGADVAASLGCVQALGATVGHGALGEVHLTGWGAAGALRSDNAARLYELGHHHADSAGDAREVPDFGHLHR